MARSKQRPQFEVTGPDPVTGLLQIRETDGVFVAIVAAGRAQEAHLMAAAPEMYALLTELSLVRRKTDGAPAVPLLPPEALGSIELVQRRARGGK